MAKKPVLCGISGEATNCFKGLIWLADSELQEWQETAHTNSYKVDTISKCRDQNSFLNIKMTSLVEKC